MGTPGPGQEAARARVITLDGGYDGRKRVGRRSRAAPAARLQDNEDGALTQTARTALDENLERVRAATLAMGDMVDHAIHAATDALLQRDVALANEVIRGDQQVNAIQAETRELCFSAILTQAPMARHLRELLGFQHMASELERMADHCVNIARIARDLSDLPPLEGYVDIPKLSRLVATQVRDMLGALVGHDIDEARAIAARDDLVNRLYHRLVDELVQAISDEPANVYRDTKLIAVCQNFERIADRVTNIAEDLVFLESGEIEDLG